MSSKNIWIIFSLLFLVPLAMAQENFVAGSENLEISLCSCATAKDIIVVHNTGTSASLYTVTTQGDASQFSSLRSTSFILNPGQKIRLTNFISVPCDTEGNYELTIIVKTSLGLEKSFTQTISAEKCLNVDVEIKDYSLSNCQCSPTRYKFMVYNTNGFTETYDFSVKPFSDYVEITPNPVAINPKKAVPVYVDLTLPCDVLDTLNLTFNAYTRTTGLMAQVPFFITTKNCYDYTLDTEETFELCEQVSKEAELDIKNKGDVMNVYTATIKGPEWITLEYDGIRLKPGQKGIYKLNMNPPDGSEGEYDVLFETVSETGEVLKNETFEVIVENCYDFFVDIIKEEDNVCCGEYSYEVHVKNQGSKTAEIMLETDKSWAGLSEEELEVEPGKREKITLDVEPVCRDKSYEVTAKAFISEHEHIFAEDTLYLDVFSQESCYVLESKKEKATIFYRDMSSEFRFKNSGINATTYKVSMLDAPSWVKLNTTEIEILPDATGDIYLYTIPGLEVLKNTYTVDLVFEVPETEISYSHSVVLNLRKESKLVVKVKEFFRKNYTSMILGAVILVALIILYNIVIKLKEKKLRKKLKEVKVEARKEEKKKIKKPRRPLSRFWKIILTIIIIIGVLVAGFLIYYLTIYQPPVERPGSNIGIFIQDISFIIGRVKNYVVNVTSMEEVNVTEVEPKIPESFMYQYLEEGKTKEIDLASHIIDPDGDELVFTSSKPENIDVEIFDGVAYITPKSGSAGVQQIIFTGKDKKGASLSANIYLDVGESKEKEEVSGAESYWDYVLIGFVLLVVIIGVLKEIEKRSKKNSKKKK